jgi:phosphoglycerate kinase
MNVGEGQGRRSAVEEVRGAVRRLRDGRVRHRAPRPGLHPRRDPVRAAVACGGPLLMAELDALAKALDRTRRGHLLAIVAGSKVSTKLELLSSLVVQGRPAHRRRRHRQHLPRRSSATPVGKSLCETRPASTPHAAFMADARARGAEIPVPSRRRGRAGVQLPNAPATVKQVDAGDGSEDMILDIGPDTAARYAAAHRQGWHRGLERPGGRVRVRCLRQGHRKCLPAPSPRPNAFSIAGGGDTLAAVDKYGVGDGRLLHLHRRRRLPRIPAKARTLPAVSALLARAPR